MKRLVKIFSNLRICLGVPDKKIIVKKQVYKKIDKINVKNHKQMIQVTIDFKVNLNRD